MASNAVRLDRLLRIFGNWLYLPDLGVVEITLATVAANRIPGDPVWLMQTGPSSSGKTEVLNSLSSLPDIHSVATLTEAALLSGTPKRDCTPGATGGLLHKIGPSGIVVLKDFTSILSMNRDKRMALLAAFREIFDGAWTRCVGVDGGRNIEWRGKLGLIGGVTSAIDSHHAVMSAMGARFAQYRLLKTDGDSQARRAIEKTGREEDMRVELASEVYGLFDGIDFDHPLALPSESNDWLVALTTLVATCRSAVERDSYTREVELIHDAEAPARLTRMLAHLPRGLHAIGVKPRRARDLIVKVGFDCIPPVRRLALEALLNQSSDLTTFAVAETTKYPEQTVRRALQDLNCHGVVERCAPHKPGDLWRVAPQWRQRFDIARGTFPKC
jgi:hypothetical protein